jgi:putative ABC transport system ATP-binding protein
VFTHGQGFRLSIARFEVPAGQRVFIQGGSGSGKSTLLQLLAGVLVPQQGRLQVLGHALTDLSATARDQCRAAHVGFVFQQFNLLPYLTVEQNILLGVQWSRLRRQRALLRHGSLRQAAAHWQDALGLLAIGADQRTDTLSVGQQQRVAVARALIGEPELILADEPTSALDPGQQQVFMDALLSQVKSTGSTLLMVSHNPLLAAAFDRTVDMTDLAQIAHREAV